MHSDPYSQQLIAYFSQLSFESHNSNANCHIEETQLNQIKTSTAYIGQQYQIPT
jgi:hypothetical protein